MNRKLIFRIARTELATLFYSPIAWLLLVAFAIQVGLDFSDIIAEIVKIKVLRNSITFSATAGVVLGSKGIFEVIQSTIYLYIPLLTMNLMSREYASGSIKLLYSSPLNSIHIIGGKFLSMIVFSLLFVAILALPVVAMAITIPGMDITLFLAGLLSMFLLILTYCAIGLFMSTLTSYQVVSAVATFSILAFLNYVGEIGQASPFIRDITFWFSIRGRASEMLSGLICSDDVIYFLSVITLFLWFSVIKINNERTRRLSIAKIMRYFAALGTIIIIGFFSSRPAMMTFYDATHSKVRTLCIESQQVMTQLTGPLTITTYVDIFDTEFSIASPREQKNDYTRFKMYTRYKPEIKMKYVYYYSTPTDSALYKRYPEMSVREIAYEVARTKKFNPKKLKSAEELIDHIDLAREDYQFVRVVERGSGEQARLRLFDDNIRHPSETEISAALKKMIADPVKVGTLTGHQERSISRKGDQDYSIFATRGRFRQSMINQGFDVIEVDLDKGDVPDYIGILLIAEMRTPLNERESAAIDRFIARGGNMMIMADVGRQEAMNPLLHKFGIKISDGIIAQPSEINPYSLVLSKGTQEAADKMGGFYKRMIMNPERNSVTMPSAVALEVVDSTVFKPTVLLLTDADRTWIEYETTNFFDQTPTLDSNRNERLGGYPTALAITRIHEGFDKEQRIIVLGDADCFSNAELQISRPEIISYNFSMIPGSFRWLCYGQFPIVSTRKPNRDMDIHLTPLSMPIVKRVYCFAIPLAIGFIGVVVWRRRRKH